MKKNNRGMTIIECVVAFSIITIVSLMSVSGFLASASFVRRGIDLNRAGAAAAANTESKSAGVASNQTLTIEMPSGGSQSISGRVFTAKETVNNITVEFSTFDRS